MGVWLGLNLQRVVTEANYITMVNPTMHPDRVMGDHDLLYMLDGTWEIGEENVDGSGREVWEMRSDDLLLLPAGRHHFGNRLCSPNNRHMYIHVRPCEAEVSAGPSDLRCFHSLIHCQSNPRIREIFEEIIARSWEDSPFREEKISLLLNLLFCELLEQQEKPVQSGSGKNIAAEAARLIQTTPQKFFTGRELADLFYVCERTLSNQFKKAYGKTLYAYQMDVKLEMVKQFLITQPEVKLHETALNFGFCDEFHLSKTFSRRYGISPSAYRQQYGGSAFHKTETI